MSFKKIPHVIKLAFIAVLGLYGCSNHHYSQPPVPHGMSFNFTDTASSYSHN